MNKNRPYFIQLVGWQIFSTSVSRIESALWPWIESTLRPRIESTPNPRQRGTGSSSRRLIPRWRGRGVEPVTISSLIVAFFLSLVIWPFALSAQTEGIYQKVNWQFTPGVETELIKAQLYQAYPFLESRGAHLVLERDISSPGGRHLQFRQYYHDWPIHQAGVKVNLNRQGRTTSILSTLQSFQPVAPPDFVYDTTGLAARMGEVAAAKAIYVEARYLLRNEKLHPVYRIETESLGAVPSYEILIDGVDGTELSRRDLSAYFRPRPNFRMQGDTSGYGRVFNPDPCTTAEVAYGVSFSDNNDAHSPVFDALLDTVELKDLKYENGIFKLEGPHVKLVDRANFTIAPATSTDGNFFFNRDASGFEDVMVYYHIDTYHRYVESLGFHNLLIGGNPIPADAHGQGDSDQSAFIRNNGDPFILFGDGGVDDGEDADVIVHEYCHALSYAASPETNDGRERQGLDEGMADYFAATYSLRLNPFNGQNIFNWDGHNEFWPGRIVNSTQTYPPTSTSIYRYGEIWSAALMQMQEEVGDSIVDRLMLQTLYGLYVNMLMPDAARLFLDADSALYNGLHTNTIRFYFCERGLLSNPECINVSLEEELPGAPLDWAVFPNPSAGNFTVNWNANGEREAAVLTLFDVQGKQILQKPVSSGQSQLQLDLPAGLYLLQLQTSSGQMAHQRLVVRGQ
jgi:hypothetical protein